MRPQTIVSFERIFLFTLLLGLVQVYFGWGSATQTASVGFALTVQIFTFCLLVGLALLVSRRRSNVAKWILIALFTLGLPAFFGLISRGMLLGSVWIAVLQILGQLIAYALLFTASAHSWLNQRN